MKGDTGPRISSPPPRTLSLYQSEGSPSSSLPGLEADPPGTSCLPLARCTTPLSRMATQSTPSAGPPPWTGVRTSVPPGQSKRSWGCKDHGLRDDVLRFGHLVIVVLPFSPLFVQVRALLHCIQGRNCLIDCCELRADIGPQKPSQLRDGNAC
jgi:hypothetical protein